MATRRERVILDLAGNFTTEMARSAAATALLNRELDKLDGASIRVDRNLRTVANNDIPALGRNAQQAGSQIDRMSGRLRILADVAAALGPSLIPIGGVGIAGLAGLANQFGVAAIAGGSAIVAFQGVGDALTAMNKADLEPTVENLGKVEEEMGKLSPAAQRLARQIFDLRDEWGSLKRVAATALLPGVSNAIDAFEGRLPDVKRVVREMNSTLGSLLEDAGKSLGGPEWDDFFDFLATDATVTLRDLGVTVGRMTHGFTELWMAFAPLNADFASWLADIAQSFDGWAEGLDATDGFQEFVDYIRETGPQVADTFGSLANAILQIIQAAAPLGGPTLRILESFADVLSAIADSPIGSTLLTGLAGLAAYNRALSLTAGLSTSAFGRPHVARLQAARLALSQVRAEQNLTGLSAREMGKASFFATQQIVKGSSERARAIRAGAATTAKGAAALTGLAIASTGAADGLGLTNTASLAMMGTLAGPWGAAMGGAIGLVQDFAAANNEVEDALRQARFALTGDAGEMRDALAALQEQSDGLADTGGPFAFKDNWKTVASAFSGDASKIREAAEALNLKLEDSENASGDIADIMRGVLQPELRRTKDAFKVATDSAKEFGEMVDGVNQILDDRASLRSYQEAIRDAGEVFKDRADLAQQIRDEQKQLAEDQRQLDKATTPSERRSAKDQIAGDLERIAELRAALKELRTDLDITTEQGSQNQAALDEIARSALAVAEAMKNRGEDPTFFLDKAREQFIRVGRSFGMTREAARALADELKLIDVTVATPQIAPKGIEESDGKISRLQRKVDRLTKGYTGDGRYNFTVDAETTKAERKLARLSRHLVALGAVSIPVGIKNPSLILDDDYDTGGWTGPGGKYEPAGVVHRDEFVFSKEATSGNVAYLESLHRSLRGFADGGWTGPDRRAMPQSVQSWSNVTNNYAAASSGRSYAGMFDGATFRHNDMRETLRQTKQIATLVDGGGVAF